MKLIYDNSNVEYERWTETIESKEGALFACYYTFSLTVSLASTAQPSNHQSCRTHITSHLLSPEPAGDAALGFRSLLLDLRICGINFLHGLVTSLLEFALGLVELCLTLLILKESLVSKALASM